MSISGSKALKTVTIWGVSVLSNKIVITSITIVTIVIVTFFGVYSRNREITLIQGTYKAFPEVDLRRVEVEFTLFSSKDRSPVKKYSTRLGKDGSFNIRVREEGEYLLTQTGQTFPDSVFIDPMFSSDRLTYFYKFRRGSVITLDELYICEAIKLLSPVNGGVYNEPNEVVFAWQKIPFADFYGLNIVQIHDDGNEEYLITTGCDANSIGYGRLRDLQIMETKQVGPETFAELGAYNTKFTSLKTGRYWWYVTAYKFRKDKKGHLTISRSSDLAAFQMFFSIE